MRASLYLFLAIAILAVVVSSVDAAEDGLQVAQPGGVELIVSTELNDVATNCLF